MAALHSLLAVYGAFDQSVVEADDPKWSALVDRYLRGATGENQRGWFREVKDLVAKLVPSPAGAEFPSLREVLEELNDLAAQMNPLPPADGSTPQSDIAPSPPPLINAHIGARTFAVATAK